MTATAYFSESYGAARRAFLAACADAGAAVENHRNPAAARDGEALFTDVARIGAPAASRLFIATSGTHGVEGFCGSACQVGYLREGLFRGLPSDTAMVLVHAINPHGFAHLRRVTEDNVDLNRNFVDHGRPRPASPAYTEVHDFLNPEDWDGPARAAADQAIEAYIAERGLKAFQAAVTGGQYGHPDGLFHGGRKPTWSNRTWRRVIADHARGARHIAYIDFHTGLGPYGYGEPIYSGPAGSAELARARHWYGADVTATQEGDSSSAKVQGDMPLAFQGAVGDARLTPIALEYGTVPIAEALTALRGDNWLHPGGDPDSPQGQAIMAAMRDAFYPDADDWKEMVWSRAAEIGEKALAGLRNS